VFRAVCDGAPSYCSVLLLILVAPSSVLRFHEDNIVIAPLDALSNLHVGLCVPKIIGFL